MMGYIKNHKLALLLVGMALLTVLRVVIPFYSGYYGSFFDIFLLCTEGIPYILMVSFVIITIASKGYRQHKVLFALVMVFLIFAGFIHTGHFMTLGALLSAHNADPKQIRDAARMLIDKYEPMTHFGYFPERPPFDKPISKDKLPSSLLDANI